MPAQLRPLEPIGGAKARLLLLHAHADRRRAEWLPELEPGHRGQQPAGHELADEPHARLAAIPDVGAEVHLQVNFRTYIRYRGEPGVWFIREFVPSRLLAAVAWLKFGEPFGTAPISVRVEEQESSLRASYRLEGPELGWHLTMAGSRATHVPPADSAEHYFKERVLACRARRHGGLGVFRVAHPPWAVREVIAVDYRVDFGFLYGADWRFLNDARPVSAIFAPGSDVTVYPPVRAPSAPPG